MAARFWMVWCPTGHAPRVRHTSFSSAENEAKRLAKLNAGAEFFVLRAEMVARVKPNPVSVEWLDPPDLSF